jgi:hypothetical protein
MAKLDNDAMDNPNYKHFTPEEEKIYDRAMAEIKEKMDAAGYTLDEACNEIDLEDEELRHFIKEDYLKMLIADLHYSKRKSFEEIAELVSVDLERVQQAHREMVEDVKQASIAAYREVQKQHKGSA